MLTIEDIKQSVQAEFQAFEKNFNAVFRTENPLLQSIFDHVLAGKGKQIRPILTLLAAKLCGEINQCTLNVAVSLELLHTATLIHDDVVDETYQRRGNPSINAHWDNKIAILSGDFMLSHSLYTAVQTANLEILQLISSVGKELADGELLQIPVARKSMLPEEAYFRIIRKKTALLFSVCTESGAISVDAAVQEKTALRSFGENLGMCFQIQDDIFDYSENKNIGKPVGNDIREGKVTLPLILALKNADEQGRREVSAIIDNGDFSPENIEKILHFTRQNNGIALAQDYMETYKNQAAAALDFFPESAVKTALLGALEYTTRRNK
ncbi:MAG: polyprenyl synthetase family protein [Prevotellaceae bacterium]|jgi:octaprenyl-diphosphate synthase|nr:polyprenyl synthetase family protein [Prevotellaceae bacterium]